MRKKRGLATGVVPLLRPAAGEVLGRIAATAQLQALWLSVAWAAWARTMAGLGSAWLRLQKMRLAACDRLASQSLRWSLGQVLV
jgi:hypothetical protein